MPLRNIVTIILASGLAVWGYFTVAERLNQLSTTLTMLKISVEANNEFRIRWPRGELGALPDDSEQFMLIQQLREQFDRLSEKIEEGRAPSDQQQTLRLEFLKSVYDDWKKNKMVATNYEVCLERLLEHEGGM